MGRESTASHASLRHGPRAECCHFYSLHGRCYFSFALLCMSSPPPTPPFPLPFPFFFSCSLSLSAHLCYHYLAVVGGCPSIAYDGRGWFLSGRMDLSILSLYRPQHTGRRGRDRYWMLVVPAREPGGARMTLRDDATLGRVQVPFVLSTEWAPNRVAEFRTVSRFELYHVISAAAAPSSLGCM